MLVHFATVLAFAVMGALMVFGALLLGSFLRPNAPDAVKNMIYECGERPTGKAWINFNPRFYVIALIFVIFDVEIAFMFPVGVVFRAWVENGRGWLAFGELAVFVAILLLGLAYVWVKGDLEWIKRIDARDDASVASKGHAS